MENNTPKILILDDELESLSGQISVLKSVKKYDVYTTRSIEEAFNLIRSIDVDVFLVDYVLGVDNSLNGDQVIKVIRQEEKKGGYKSYLPCILISSTENLDEDEELKNSLRGFEYDWHSKKKSKMPTLFDLIDRCIEKKRTRNKITQDLRLEHQVDKAQTLPSTCRKGGEKPSSGVKQFIKNKFVWAIFTILFLPLAGKLIYHYYVAAPQKISRTVAVNVVTADNAPLQNASIIIEGTPFESRTDINGYAHLDVSKAVSEKENITLLVVKEGFTTIRKSYNWAGGPISIILDKKAGKDNSKRKFMANSFGIRISVLTAENYPVKNVLIIVEGYPTESRTDDSGYASLYLPLHMLKNGELTIIANKEGFLTSRKTYTLGSKSITIILVKNTT